MQTSSSSSSSSSGCKPFFARIECWKDTQALAATSPAPPASEKLCFFSPEVSVEDADSIDCALRYLHEGHNPVVLNLADDCFPGGCVDLGSGAQEESLFRRTNLCRTLDLSFYPIRDDELVYSPGVTVFKSSEAKDWVPLDAPSDVKLAFITCPGIKNPVLDHPSINDDDPQAARLKPRDEARLRAKIRNVLRAARAKGHDVPVLGAMGCGAWRCPARHVAEVFKAVLAEEYELCSAFARVVFAVKARVDDMYITREVQRVDNHDVFCDVFRDALFVHD